MFIKKRQYTDILNNQRKPSSSVVRTTPSYSDVGDKIYYAVIDFQDEANYEAPVNGIYKYKAKLFTKLYNNMYPEEKAVPIENAPFTNDNFESNIELDKRWVGKEVTVVSEVNQMTYSSLDYLDRAIVPCVNRGSYYECIRQPLGFPYGAIHPFGIARMQRSTGKVTVAAGQLIIGAEYLETAETEVTITKEGQYIGLEYRSTGYFNSNSLKVTGPHDTRPVTEGEYFRTWLYIFSFTSSSENGQSLHLVRHNLSAIHLLQAW